MGKVVTREWRKAKSAKLEFVFVSAFRDNSSFGLNILGPLCLWQCLSLTLTMTLTFTLTLTFKLHLQIDGASSRSIECHFSSGNVFFFSSEMFFLLLQIWPKPEPTL